jgi:hypothetical protein
MDIASIQLWDAAKRLVAKVRLDDCRCHELARAVAIILDPEATKTIIEDGKLGPVEHSWIRIKPLGHVLDVYRPGCMPQVILLDSLMTYDYATGRPRLDIRHATLTKLLEQIRA